MKQSNKNKKWKKANDSKEEIKGQREKESIFL